MERRRIRFSGRVQGVGFRATARSIARRYPLTGWVRNQEDGDVLLEAQGETPVLESFLKALRERMAGNIAGEDAVGVPPAEGESGFEIRR